MTWHQVLLVMFAVPSIVLIGKWVGVGGGWVNMIVVGLSVEVGVV